MLRNKPSLPQAPVPLSGTVRGFASDFCRKPPRRLRGGGSLKKILLAITLTLFVFFSFKTLESHIFSIHFVDEDENMIAGHYMAKGEKLYSDIFSHKQPMPAVFSAFINKISQPNSLFLFIKRHREAVFFYSVFWWLIFLFEFGFSGLIFSVVLELSKRFLFGDLFLGESLVIFPLAYVLGCLWKLDWGEAESFGLKRCLFLFSLVLIPFQLFALIPFSIVVSFYIILRSRFKRKLVIYLLGIFILFFLIFLPFVSYPDYYWNTKAAVTSHYLKDTVNQGFFRLLSLSLFKPLTVLISPQKEEFGNFIWYLSCVYLFSFIYLLFKEKRKKPFLFFSFFLLGITSTRLTVPHGTFYGGFHGLPWFSLLLFLIIFQLKEVILLNKNSFKQDIVCNSFVFFAVLILIWSGHFLIKDYFRKVDRERDFWVNFSRFLGTGRVIKTLSVGDDRLMVIPVEQLLYFQSELVHQNRFLYTYEWIFRDEKLRNELKKNLENNLPAFIFYDYASVGDDAKSLLDPIFADYIQLRENNLPSNLLLRKDKLDNLEDRQIEGIKHFSFTISGVGEEEKKEK